MRPSRFRATVLLLCLGVLPLLGGCAGDDASSGDSPAPDDGPVELSSPSGSPLDTLSSPEADVPFVESPQPVVDKILELANVTKTDVVYDLGSGDGRIPIAAARDYGARGVGIEIKPRLVEKARQNAENAGVGDRVTFRQGDLFEADISEATVVTLYLLPSVNAKLRPKLFRELAPGTRVVSHDFDMNEWAPDTTWTSGGETVYRWTIPEEPPPFVDAQQ
jgi:SAM-dependent methyltransferase